MTAEMIDEATVPTPEDIIPETYERTTQRPVRRPDALATQEELGNLDEMIAWFEEKNGPVPDAIREQFYADLAAADAKIGYVR